MWITSITSTSHKTPTSSMPSSRINGNLTTNSRFSSDCAVPKYELHDNIYLDPRLGFKYLLSDNLTFKGSWGRFSQFLFTVNDEDQVLQIVDFWLPVPKEYDAIQNQHFILGFERWFSPGFTGSVETYYKPYSNVLTSNLGNDPGRAFDEFISGTGRVWGLELFLKKTAGKIYRLARLFILEC